MWSTARGLPPTRNDLGYTDCSQQHNSGHADGRLRNAPVRSERRRAMVEPVCSGQSSAGSASLTDGGRCAGCPSTDQCITVPGKCNDSIEQFLIVAASWQRPPARSRVCRSWRAGPRRRRCVARRYHGRRNVNGLIGFGRLPARVADSPMPCRLVGRSLRTGGGRGLGRCGLLRGGMR